MPSLRRTAPLLAFVGAMWAIRIADSFRSDGLSIAGSGIIPREGGALTGILTAPLIHANWPHLFANTLPLLILGALLLVDSVAEFVFVTIAAALVGGFGTWLFGAHARHVGASGVIFGYVGYLLVRPFFDRRIGSAVVTLLVGAIYGTALLYSLVPREGISWSGHAFGFVGGVVAAALRGRPKAPDADFTYAPKLSR